MESALSLSQKSKEAGNPEIEGGKKSRLATVVDLFAGCGGLSLGLENAGFTPVFVSELNDDALATYLANRHHDLGGLDFAENSALHCQDVSTLDQKRLAILADDLARIPEVNYHRDARGKPTSGAGSSLDLVVGGPPCQGFSGIGHRRSYSVNKIELPSNQLYVRMATVIRQLRPRAFVFENVRGLLNSKWVKGGDDLIWPDVLAEYRRIEGYEVRWSLVHAKNYGVAQNRPRVLMVGLRKDWLKDCKEVDPSADPEDAVACGFLPPPRKNSYPDLEELLGDLVDDEVEEALLSGEYPSPFETTAYPKPARTAVQKEMRRRRAGSPGGHQVLTEQEYSRHAADVVRKFKYMLGHGGKIPKNLQTKKFSQRLLPAAWGEGGPTITATSLPDDYVHFSQPRILTVREWARLQMFPDWYIFKGKRTTGGIRRAGNPREGIFDREVPKYTQIGNAVPVKLAEHVGKHLRKLLAQSFS